MLKVEKLLQYCIDKYYECERKCIKNEITYEEYINLEQKYKSSLVKLKLLRRRWYDKNY